MTRRPIRSKWLSNCSGTEIQQLNRLRLKGDSMMYEDVICAKIHRDRIRIFMAEEDRHIVGWSSVLLPGAGNKFPIPCGSKYAPIYTYVNKAYRGLGLGKRLIRMSYKFLKKRRYKPTVFYYDSRSAAFFRNLKKKHISKLLIYGIGDWWNIYD